MIEIYVDGSLARTPETQDPNDVACVADGCDLDATWAFDPDAFPVGTREIEIRATDPAGNTSSEIFAISNTHVAEAPSGLRSGTSSRLMSPVLSAPVVGDGAVVGQEPCSFESRMNPSVVARVNGGWDGGTSTTDFLADGSYYVTHCDERGVPLESRAVTRLDTVAGQVTVATSGATRDATGVSEWFALRPARQDPVWANLKASPGLAAEVLPPDTFAGRAPVAFNPRALRVANASRPRGTAESALASGFCDPAISFHTHDPRLTWPDGNYGGSVGITINPANSNIGGRRTNARFADGIRTWLETLNHCGRKSIDNFHMDHLRVSTDAGVNDYGDGKNAIGFVRYESTFVAACTEALACARIHRKSSPFSNSIDEADIVLDGSYRPDGSKIYSWFSRLKPPAGCTNSYDIWGVVVHEVGHGGIGLDHNPDHIESVMYPTADLEKCSTTGRLLSTGDVAGVRYQYP
jgi:hypothetical protein